MTPFRFISAIAFAVAGSLPVAAHSASFDCGAARSSIEHAICDNPELSALDSELADAYRAALKQQGGATDQLKATQRQWLQAREQYARPMSQY